jgi:hypothetical protein
VNEVARGEAEKAGELKGDEISSPWPWAPGSRIEQAPLLLGEEKRRIST